MRKWKIMSRMGSQITIDYFHLKIKFSCVLARKWKPWWHDDRGCTRNFTFTELLTIFILNKWSSIFSLSCIFHHFHFNQSRPLFFLGSMLFYFYWRVQLGSRVYKFFRIDFPVSPLWVWLAKKHSLLSRFSYR